MRLPDIHLPGFLGQLQDNARYIRDEQQIVVFCDRCPYSYQKDNKEIFRVLVTGWGVYLDTMCRGEFEEYEERHRSVHPKHKLVWKYDRNGTLGI